MDFLALSQQCGLDVNPVTTMAIIKSESAFDPLIIRDNTTKITLHFSSKKEAVKTAHTLNDKGHKLAIGLMQVTTPWLRTYHIKPEVLLDACSNIRYGTTILANNYRAYLPKSATEDEALQHALSAYWSGNPDTGGAYVNYVYGKAGSPVRVDETPGITDGVLVSDSSTSSKPASHSGSLAFPDSGKDALYLK